MSMLDAPELAQELDAGQVLGIELLLDSADVVGSSLDVTLKGILAIEAPLVFLLE